MPFLQLDHLAHFRGLGEAERREICSFGGGEIQASLQTVQHQEHLEMLDMKELLRKVRLAKENSKGNPALIEAFPYRHILELTVSEAGDQVTIERGVVAPTFLRSHAKAATHFGFVHEGQQFKDRMAKGHFLVGWFLALRKDLYFSAISLATRSCSISQRDTNDDQERSLQPIASIMYSLLKALAPDLQPIWSLNIEQSWLPFEQFIPRD